MKILLLLLSLLLILLVVGLWVGPGSYPERWRIEERSQVQEQANKQRKQEINKMQAELDDVSSGSAAIEERARSQLGMTKKGETFYKVILQDKKITNTDKKPIIIDNPENIKNNTEEKKEND